MKENENTRKGYGLFYSRGWKKNLGAVAVSFAICLFMQILTLFLARVRVISNFDFSIAIMPILGFLFGIWGVIGCMLGTLAPLILVVITASLSGMGYYGSMLAVEALIVLIYSALPCFLWYIIRLPGEDKVRYPRMDTTGHVVKYYLIMLMDVAIYVALHALLTKDYYVEQTILGWAATYTQYLDVVLIVGIPVLVIASLIRYKTATINERMVLSFLAVGAAAAILGALMVYRNTMYLKPEIFNDYDAFMYDLESEVLPETEEIIDRYYRFWDRFYIIIAVMLNGLLLLELFLMRGIEKKVTRPIIRLAGVLEDYTASDEELNSSIVQEECGGFLEGYGEVSSLTRTCVDMVTDINDYTRNLQQVTSEKERIGTELDIASRIQRDMLPGIFPPFPERKEISLFASMTPAREVGGDFYDFYFTDHDHLVLTIADVSDKGIPASLFMVISKTLMQDHAHNGGSPKEILTYVNHQLCQSNTSFMFCTVWLGILDLRTGKLTAANAGHEYPIIRGKDGSFGLVEAKHDPPLGIRDGFRYHEYEMTLAPGDILFEYTDGVTEAENAGEEMFGEDRLVRALNESEDDTPEVLIGKTYDAIHHFVKEAAQFDDITMLCVKYMGNVGDEKKNRASITVPARKDQLDEVIAFVEGQLESCGADSGDVFTITLAVEEIFVNIASYAYDGEEGKATLEWSFDPDSRKAELVFKDQGIPFDPTIRPEPDIHQAAGARPIGGLGIHIVKKTMDEVQYTYEGGNVLKMAKKI